jgi:hypothetical protein
MGLTRTTRGTGPYATVRRGSVLYAFSLVLKALGLVWPDFQKRLADAVDITRPWPTCAMQFLTMFGVILADFAVRPRFAEAAATKLRMPCWKAG